MTVQAEAARDGGGVPLSFCSAQRPATRLSLPDDAADAPKLGSEAGLRSWAPKLGSEAGLRSWAPKLGTIRAPLLSRRFAQSANQLNQIAAGDPMDARPIPIWVCDVDDPVLVAELDRRVNRRVGF
jgi:hypothetical protein